MPPRKFSFYFLWLLFLFPLSLFAEWGIGGCERDLMDDLEIVDAINNYLNEEFPVYYNNLLYGGYFNMPSALMGKEGEVGMGASWVPPYRNYNLRLQFMDRVEISGNYRIFTGVDDPILTDTGYGDKTDKGANIKVALIHPESTNFTLPGIAVGLEDFTGTKGFESRYIVFTQVLPKWNVECSLGYGQKRIKKWFGGVTWIPFRCCLNPYIKDIAFAAEYDATAYKSLKREPHPKGHSTKSHINFGLKYRLSKYFDFSASYIRGKKFSYSCSTYYNFGMTEGFMPKIQNPLPYSSPRNIQAIGPLRPTDVLVQDLTIPFCEQGLEIKEMQLSIGCYGNKILRIQVRNLMYRYENEVHLRLNDLLANLIPIDISEVVVVLVDGSLPIQEYRFQMEYVRMYGEKEICPFEMQVITPEKNVRNSCGETLLELFKGRKDGVCWEVFPKTYAAFGSAKGKFKYLIGAYLGLSGYFLDNWYYNVLFGYTFFSKLYDVSSVDRLNPSQIINVRTDTVEYFKKERFTVDEAYLQKSVNLGCGWFGALSFGLFEEAYGGVNTQLLYYPVHSNFAFGIEGAYLRKRAYSGIGFTNVVRKLEGFCPTWKKYHGSQYFGNLYYNFDKLDIDLHLKAGKFLAHDWGVRTELSKYYPSGMRFYTWYTYTNAKDYVNGQRYQDHGIGFSIPLDIFYPYSSRNRWGFGMSAWLRDVGAVAETGIPLYCQIRNNRECSISRIKRGVW